MFHIYFSYLSTWCLAFSCSTKALIYQSSFPFIFFSDPCFAVIPHYGPILIICYFNWLKRYIIILISFFSFFQQRLFPTFPKACFACLIIISILIQLIVSYFVNNRSPKNPPNDIEVLKSLSIIASISWIVISLILGRFKVFAFPRGIFTLSSIFTLFWDYLHCPWCA